MPTWVSLLRAVNLGARNKVNMPALRDSLGAAGFDDVRTYVQSGNIVARSSHRSPAKVAAAVHQVIADDFGMDVPVVVRSGRDLADVVAANPFGDAAARPVHVHVIFLAARPAAAAVAAFEQADLGPDRARVAGSDVYAWYADASKASRVGAALRRLGVEGTARNWRTVTTLAQLAAEDRR